MTVSLFAHSTLAAAPVTISHHVMILANTSASQDLQIASNQVHATVGNDSYNQSSSVQSAESSSVLPAEQVTLQQSEALQKNVSGSQLVIDAPANLLEQPASIVSLGTLSISHASSTLTISRSTDYAPAQTLAVVQVQTPHIIEPFAIGNSQQRPAQAVLTSNGQQKNDLGNLPHSNSNSNAIADAAIYGNTQLNISQFAAASIEVLRC